MLSAARLLAFVEGGDRAEDGVVGGDVPGVVLGGADRRRAFEVVIAAGAHRPAQRQPDRVGPGPLRPRAVLAERRDAQHNQPRVGVGQQDGIEEALRRGLRGLQHDVGLRGEAEEEVESVVVGEVERERALVGVVVPPEEGALRPGQVVEEGADSARRVARGRLDFDHIRAQIGQQLAGVLAEGVAQVEHPRAVQRCRAAHAAGPVIMVFACLTISSLRSLSIAQSSPRPPPHTRTLTLRYPRQARVWRPPHNVRWHGRRRR